MSWVTKKNISEFVLKHIDRNATLVKDGAASYTNVGRKYENIVINHLGGRQVPYKLHWELLEPIKKGDHRHTPPSQPKAFAGILQRISFRFNHRKLHDGFRFTLAMQQIEGRLTYKQLVYGKSQENQEGYDFEPIETGE